MYLPREGTIVRVIWDALREAGSSGLRFNELLQLYINEQRARRDRGISRVKWHRHEDMEKNASFNLARSLRKFAYKAGPSCSRTPWIFGKKPVEVHERSLEDELAALTTKSFLDSFSLVWPGKEDEWFSSNDEVQKVIKQLILDQNAKQKVDAFLNKLFVSFPDIDVTESAMALLFSLAQARVSFFNDIANVFANTRAAELGRISRYTKHLMKKSSEASKKTLVESSAALEDAVDCLYFNCTCHKVWDNYECLPEPQVKKALDIGDVANFLLTEDEA